MDKHEEFISDIYDCAANPELWPETLMAIRDHFGAAYVQVGISDIAGLLSGGMPNTVYKNSPWDQHWLQEVGRHFQSMPGYNSLFYREIDQPWVQMQECTEDELRKSVFYQKWVAPQKLRDCITVPLVRRQMTAGFLSIASREGRALFNDKEAAFAAALSPHFRRAVAISDVVDRNRLELALHRSVLDQMSVPVIVVAAGRRIVIANAAAETMLSEGHLVKSVSGALAAARGDEGLGDAIDRAGKGDLVIGLKGIGVPLVSTTGERAAAYVLPIAGKDLRSEMGKGFATVFLARRGEHLPTAIEVLRSMFDLSQMEARVAAMIANGTAPTDIAAALGSSVNTIRTHLKRAFEKTNTPTQSALTALINGLMPPVVE